MRDALLHSKLWHIVTAHPVAATFAVALASRLLVALAFADFFSGTFVLDDSTYTQMATDRASGDISHWDPYTHFLYDVTATFMLPLTLIYDIFGTSEIVGRIYVALLGAGAAALVTRVAMEAIGRRWAIAAGLVVALLPSQVLWSSLILKDAAVWIVLATLALVVALAGRSRGATLAAYGVAAAGLLILMGHLRLHTTVVAAWALMGAAWAGSRAQRLPRAAGAVAIGLAIPWLVGLGPAGLSFVTDAGSLQERRIANAAGATSAFVSDADGGGATERREEADELRRSRERVSARATALGDRPEDARARARDIRSRARGRPGPDPDLGEQARALARRARRIELRIASIEARAATIDARLAALEEAEEPAPPPPLVDDGGLEADIAHLPRGILVMLFEPVPWQDGESASFEMARAENLLWYPLLLLGLVGLWRARSHLRVLAFPILAGGGSLLVYALAEGNIGTAFRHRGEFVWVVALLAALGAAQLARRGSPERADSGP
ncbi:MAG: hypothetical protein ACRDKB_08420 [Actinomycetota bacterium]